MRYPISTPVPGSAQQGSRDKPRGPQPMVVVTRRVPPTGALGVMGAGDPAESAPILWFTLGDERFCIGVDYGTDVLARSQIEVIPLPDPPTVPRGHDHGPG